MQIKQITQHKYYGEVKGRLPWVRKVSDRQLVTVFKKLGTLRKIAKALNVKHATIWYRLKKLGVRG